jgi:hypothetical protein
MLRFCSSHEMIRGGPAENRGNYERSAVRCTSEVADAE